MKLALFTFFAFVVTTLSVLGAPRPNILYIYVDDMGWGSLGPNGQFARGEAGKPRVLTPNLDALAARSINFTRAYGCTVCSPARSSQQTGFHQGHTFADRNDPNNAKKAIRADDFTMGDALSKAGYATGYWGKWGYGGSKDMANPTIDNIQTLPSSHGYQHILAELHHVRAHTFFQPTLWSAPAKQGAVGGLELVPNSMASYKNKKDYPDLPALQNHPKYPEVAYCDDCYCFSALDFVREQASGGKPFFGLLAVQVPHAPFDEIAELPEWNSAYKELPEFKKLNNQTKQWAAMVTRIDGHIGHLLKALDDPNNDGDTSDSVAENTLVIFQSDNGGPGGPALKELDTNGGLRGTKGSIFEGGIRVPTMMRWPAKITSKSTLKAGTNCDKVIDVSDLLPTFCELAGVESPVGVDGVSLAPTLLGEGEQRVREFVIHEAGKNSRSIIRGKDKLIMASKKLELYDLENDPGEQTNLAENSPKLVKELQPILLAERVTEPRGFANTYHHWTGENGAATSDPKNWSDYTYSNAGVTYLEDSGAPQLSWIGRVENKDSEAAKAIADKDLAFLGLEIKGGQATQELSLGKGKNLTARNELRISAQGILSIDGGTVSSVRWVEVKPSGVIRGTGKIEGTLYNSGKVELAGASHGSHLVVEGLYKECEFATLAVSRNSTLKVSGKASLAGELQIEFSEGEFLNPILTADHIMGRFSNKDNIVIGKDGARYMIDYSSVGEVNLKLIASPPNRPT